MQPISTNHTLKKTTLPYNQTKWIKLFSLLTLSVSHWPGTITANTLLPSPETQPLAVKLTSAKNQVAINQTKPFVTHEKAIKNHNPRQSNHTFQSETQRSLALKQIQAANLASNKLHNEWIQASLDNPFTPSTRNMDAPANLNPQQEVEFLKTQIELQYQLATAQEQTKQILLLATAQRQATQKIINSTTKRIQEAQAELWSIRQRSTAINRSIDTVWHNTTTSLHDMIQAENAINANSGTIETAEKKLESIRTTALAQQKLAMELTEKMETQARIAQQAFQLLLTNARMTETHTVTHPINASNHP